MAHRLVLLAAVLWACGGDSGESADSASGTTTTGGGGGGGGGGGTPGGGTTGGVDSDGDGLSDAEEAVHGSDPNLPDTDGDSYLDYDEVVEETDPTSAESRIYEGYWPYVRDKEAVTDPGFIGTAVSGQLFARFRGADQFGQSVDLYDFLEEDKLVVIDVSAAWCAPCGDVSEWLSSGSAVMDAQFPGVREAVQSGEIRWITIMGQEADGTPGEPDTSAAWDQKYPNDNVPVLADQSDIMMIYVDGDTWPTMRLLGPGLTVEDSGPIHHESFLKALSDRL